MPRVTILGGGITGMAVASLLPKSYDIVIVARDLPGDSPSQDWASPWACAGWVALGGSPQEQQMQLDALAFCTRLARSHPESSVRCAPLTDVYDIGETDAVELWYRDKVPGFRMLEEHQHPGGEGTIAIGYSSFVLDPTVFLPWLRRRLEAAGVQFERIAHIRSLSHLSDREHDVLVNASGLGSLTLEDVQDSKVVTDRTYTVVVKSDYDKIFVRRGATDYTYIFGRHNGTAVLGGISEPVQSEVRPSESVRKELIRRAHENLPDYFPSDRVEDYTIVGDLVGIRPLRLPEVRVEKDLIDGQKVVHAYGTTAGGYIYSFGLARAAAHLVEELVFQA
ncbi:nucleotide-binding domain-containing protein [Thozetella sp. PMI_491]|nr:nucleotide-binding domain-containing protein [Thozetella sp. PMI_491]